MGAIHSNAPAPQADALPLQPLQFEVLYVAGIPQLDTLAVQSGLPLKARGASRRTRAGTFGAVEALRARCSTGLRCKLVARKALTVPRCVFLQGRWCLTTWRRLVSYWTPSSGLAPALSGLGVERLPHLPRQPAAPRTGFFQCAYEPACCARRRRSVLACGSLGLLHA